MAARWTDAVRNLFAQVWLGLGAEWDEWQPSIEVRHAGEVFASRVAASNKAQPDLVITLAERDVEALFAGSAWQVLQEAEMSGRMSALRLLQKGLAAATGRPEPPDPRLISPARARPIAQEIRTRWSSRFDARELERVSVMLRMWCFDEPVPFTPHRLADLVIPGEPAAGWLDERAISLSALATAAREALTEEARPLARGEIELPPYHDDAVVWGATKGVTWGRGTLVARGVARAELDRFPACKSLFEHALPRHRLVNLAFLSMAGGREIRRHSDGFPTFASWHFGLHVPPGCTIEVAGDEREHQAGRALAFDDSFCHSAANRSTEARILLSAWVMHPALSDREAEAMAMALPLMRWGD